MQLLVVTLLDAKAEAFNVPQFVQSLGGAIRAFTDEINRPDTNNVLYNHPSDFLLYHLGTYDDQTARFEFLDVPRIIATGADLSTKGRT